MESRPGGFSCICLLRRFLVPSPPPVHEAHPGIMRCVIGSALNSRELVRRVDLVRKGGVEPPPLAGLDPKSSASANSATFAAVLPRSSVPGSQAEAGTGRAWRTSELSIAGRARKPRQELNKAPRACQRHPGKNCDSDAGQHCLRAESAHKHIKPRPRAHVNPPTRGAVECRRRLTSIPLSGV